jgi:hypothetical protein
MVNGDRGPRLLTFAGSRVNHLLAASLPEASGADEIGVQLHSPMSPADWARFAGALDPRAVADRGWPQLAEQVAVNRWFEFLPTELQRQEIVSQFISPAVLARLEALLQRDLIRSSGHSVTL